MERRENYRYREAEQKKNATQQKASSKVSSGTIGEIDILISNGQYKLAVRKAFESALNAYMQRHGKNILPSATYREFIVENLATFTSFDNMFLVTDRHAALDFINLLTWKTIAGKEEFDMLTAVSRLYFEYYEPVAYGETEIGDMKRLKHLIDQMNQQSDRGG